MSTSVPKKKKKREELYLGGVLVDGEDSAIPVHTVVLPVDLGNHRREGHPE